MKTSASALSPRDGYRVDKATREVLPRVLPASWRMTGDFSNCRRYQAGDVMVIAEVEMVDGALWLHISMSRPGRLPSWDDLRHVKDVIVGRDRKAIQVLPPEAEYVNIHPYVLHLYAALESDPLPDFRMADNEGRVGI